MNDICWGDLMPGDVVRWRVSTSQGLFLMLVVTNRYQSELTGPLHSSSFVEFFDMESGKVRKHECMNAIFVRDMNALLTWIGEGA